MKKIIVFGLCVLGSLGGSTFGGVRIAGEREWGTLQYLDKSGVSARFVAGSDGYSCTPSECSVPSRIITLANLDEKSTPHILTALGGDSSAWGVEIINCSWLLRHPQLLAEAIRKNPSIKSVKIKDDHGTITDSVFAYFALKFDRCENIEVCFYGNSHVSFELMLNYNEILYDIRSCMGNIAAMESPEIVARRKITQMQSVIQMHQQRIGRCNQQIQMFNPIVLVHKRLLCELIIDGIDGERSKEEIAKARKELEECKEKERCRESTTVECESLIRESKAQIDELNQQIAIINQETPARMAKYTEAFHTVRSRLLAKEKEIRLLLAKKCRCFLKASERQACDGGNFVAAERRRKFVDGNITIGVPEGKTIAAHEGKFGIEVYEVGSSDGHICSIPQVGTRFQKVVLFNMTDENTCRETLNLWRWTFNTETLQIENCPLLFKNMYAMENIVRNSSIKYLIINDEKEQSITDKEFCAFLMMLWRYPHLKVYFSGWSKVSAYFGERYATYIVKREQYKKQLIENRELHSPEERRQIDEKISSIAQIKEKIAKHREWMKTLTTGRQTAAKETKKMKKIREHSIEICGRVISNYKAQIGTLRAEIAVIQGNVQRQLEARKRIAFKRQQEIEQKLALEASLFQMFVNTKCMELSVTH